jgi:peptidoglycan lytic transglycosylase
MTRTVIATIAIAILLTFAALPAALASASGLSSEDTQTGMAACYARRLTGRRTASGKRYNPDTLTASHATMPVGTHVKVTNIENGKSVVLLVNDHMSAHAGGGIIMDISHRACTKLKFGRGGEARVKVEVVSSNTAAK